MRPEDRAEVLRRVAAGPGWRPGDTRVVSGATFTFTHTGGYDQQQPSWTAGALACTVGVVLSIDTKRGPLNYHVDGVRFYNDAFERALSKAVKWRLHEVHRARLLIERYDAAARAALLGMQRAAAALEPQWGKPMNPSSVRFKEVD